MESECLHRISIWPIMKIYLMGDRTIHLRTIHHTPFYLETSNCHGKVRVKVRVSVSVWVIGMVKVWVIVMVGVRMKWNSLVRWNVLRWKVANSFRNYNHFFEIDKCDFRANFQDIKIRILLTQHSGHWILKIVGLFLLFHVLFIFSDLKYQIGNNYEFVQVNQNLVRSYLVLWRRTYPESLGVKTKQCRRLHSLGNCHM